ncbi:MAG: GNAT family N-acetyltransferase [Dermatophilaceae bacterium]
MEVRVVTPQEWRLWRQLRLTALAEAPAAFGSTLADWSGAGDTEQRWRARLRDVAFNVVLTWQGEPLGMVSATGPDDQGRIELISMWIAPRARGRGVGDEAVRQVLAWAQQRHPVSRVVLSVVTDNDRAIHLYERHGFVDAGPSPDGPGERLMLHQTSARQTTRAR